jgi:hypothetical protein
MDSNFLDLFVDIGELVEFSFVDFEPGLNGPGLPQDLKPVLGVVLNSTNGLFRIDVIDDYQDSDLLLNLVNAGEHGFRHLKPKGLLGADLIIPANRYLLTVVCYVLRPDTQLQLLLANPNCQPMLTLHIYQVHCKGVLVDVGLLRLEKEGVEVKHSPLAVLHFCDLVDVLF